jgi:tetratricopeptide (TPR) repeat protein
MGTEPSGGDYFPMPDSSSARVIEEHSFSRVLLLDRRALALRNDRQYDEAEHFFLAAVNKKEAILEPGDPNTLSSITNYTSLLIDQSRWTKAEQLLTKAIETGKAIFGLEHPATLLQMSSLGITFEGQGRLSEAKHLLEKVMEGSMPLLGSEYH